MSDSSSDSGGLSQSFSASSVDSEALYESGLDAEVVDPYQFERVIHQQSQALRTQVTNKGLIKDW